MKVRGKILRDGEKLVGHKVYVSDSRGSLKQPARGAVTDGDGRFDIDNVSINDSITVLGIGDEANQKIAILDVHDYFEHNKVTTVDIGTATDNALDEIVIQATASPFRKGKRPWWMWLIIFALVGLLVYGVISVVKNRK